MLFEGIVVSLHPVSVLGIVSEDALECRIVVARP